MIPRQPSVPNLICWVIEPVVGRSSLAVGFLDQIMQFFSVKIFYDLAYVLRALPRRDQQGIWSFHYYQVAYPYYGDKLPGRMNIIAFGVRHKRPRIRHEISFRGITLDGVVVV